MSVSREILIVMIVLSGFVLVVSGASLYTQMQISSGNACGCFIPIALFIPFLASVGLFIGMLVYSLLSPSESKEKINREDFLKLFDGDERKIIGELIEKGEILQSRLVKRTGLSKVKVHRVLKKLKEKGIVEKEPAGKSNMVAISGNIKDLCADGS